MPEKNILIADDEEEIRTLLVRVLQGEDYRFFLASDGKEALDITKSSPIDLAILDIRMPGMDGHEALRRIKEIDETIEVIINDGCYGLEAYRPEAGSRRVGSPTHGKETQDAAYRGFNGGDRG